MTRKLSVGEIDRRLAVHLLEVDPTHVLAPGIARKLSVRRHVHTPIVAGGARVGPAPGTTHHDPTDVLAPGMARQVAADTVKMHRYSTVRWRGVDPAYILAPGVLAGRINVTSRPRAGKSQKGQCKQSRG